MGKYNKSQDGFHPQVKQPENKKTGYSFYRVQYVGYCVTHNITSKTLLRRIRFLGDLGDNIHAKFPRTNENVMQLSSSQKSMFVRVHFGKYSPTCTNKKILELLPRNNS